MKVELFDAYIEYKFGVSVYGFTDREDRDNKTKKMIDWCDTMFSNYKSSFSTFYFNTEQDRNWFLLKFSQDNQQHGV
jgi:hypothetical protein